MVCVHLHSQQVLVEQTTTPVTPARPSPVPQGPSLHPLLFDSFVNVHYQLIHCDSIITHSADDLAHVLKPADSPSRYSEVIQNLLRT